MFNGLNLFDRGRNKFYKIPLKQGKAVTFDPRDVINDLLFDKEENTLWVATRNGVGKLLLRNKLTNSLQGIGFKHYVNLPNDSTSIDNNNVTSISKDNQGSIWFGRDGSGWFRWHDFT